MARERSRPPSESAASDLDASLSGDRLQDEGFEDEAILQDYIARLLNMQDGRDTWLERQDLEATARDMGLSDEDLAKIDASVAAHSRRAERYRGHNRWGEAIDEYRQAVALAPFDADLTLGLARAYQGRWQQGGDTADREAAQRYARRTIDLDAEQDEAFALLDELDRRTPIRARSTASTAGPSEAKVRLSNTLLAGSMIAVVVLVLLFLLLLF